MQRLTQPLDKQLPQNQGVLKARCGCSLAPHYQII